MSTAEKQAGMMDDLAFALDQAQGGNYTEALRLVGRAKLVDPRNIFLIALEKQLRRLRGGGMLPKEKIELLQSLPGLVDRARVDGERRGVVPPSPQDSGADEKRVKLQLVLDQYFQHADEWMAKGDADAAVKEIDRVLLIDPSNRRAKEYRARIERMVGAADAKPVPALSVPETDGPSDGADASEPLPVDQPGLQAETASEISPSPRKRVVLWAFGTILVVVASVSLFMLTGGEDTPVPAPSSPAAAEKDMALANKDVNTQPEEPPVQNQEPVMQPPPEVVVPAAPRTEKKIAAVPAAQPTREREREPEPEASQPPPRLEGSTPTSLSAPVSKPGTGGTATPFIPVQKEPRILQLMQPVFTEEDHSAGVKGQIVVKVQIDKNGNPVQAKVVSSTNPILNDPVVDAVMRSSFTPGIMSSGPVVSWMTIPFRFK